MSQHLTIGEVARMYGEPDWKIRRIVDSLDSDLPRIGNYRVVPRSLLPAIGTELAKRSGHVKAEAVS